jgi:hypothetical protein
MCYITGAAECCRFVRLLYIQAFSSIQHQDQRAHIPKCVVFLSVLYLFFAGGVGDGGAEVFLPVYFEWCRMCVAMLWLT